MIIDANSVTTWNMETLTSAGWTLKNKAVYTTESNISYQVYKRVVPSLAEDTSWSFFNLFNLNWCFPKYEEIRVEFQLNNPLEKLTSDVFMKCISDLKPYEFLNFLRVDKKFNKFVCENGAFIVQYKKALQQGLRIINAMEDGEYFYRLIRPLILPFDPVKADKLWGKIDLTRGYHSVFSDSTSAQEKRQAAVINVDYCLSHMAKSPHNLVTGMRVVEGMTNQEKKNLALEHALCDHAQTL